MENRLKDILQNYPEELIEALLKIKIQGGSLFLVGGTIRDCLRGKISSDLDLVFSEGGTRFCKELISVLGGGTFVSLGGRDDEDAGRVVWKNLTIDVSAFRDGASTIFEDLCRRDFTINCMGVELKQLVGDENVELLDPLGGQVDLQEGFLRCCKNSFVGDPLRMLRGHRLQATLGLVMDEKSMGELSLNSAKIMQVSKERIHHELDLIMDTPYGYREFAQMAENGLLFHIFPELASGVGIEQPDFHHLDVFNHSLEALKWMEKIIQTPEGFYHHHLQAMGEYLMDSAVKRQLKWAALFHDLGKPGTMREGVNENERTTFHGHDNAGKKVFETIGTRQRWSNDDIDSVGRLITLHMHPFFLANNLREENLTKRAVARLAKRADAHLIGLFFLAMSDSSASQGAKKPEWMEAELDLLFDEVYTIYLENVRPVLQRKRLITGKDLIEIFNLRPSPVFREILEEVECLEIEGKLQERHEAVNWIADNLKRWHNS